MTLITIRIRSLATALAFVAIPPWVPLASAQDAPKAEDSALDNLLKKLEGAEGPEAPKPDEKPAPPADSKGGGPKSIEDGQAGDRGAKAGEAKAGEAKAGEAKASGDVAPDDKALDNLLEKLGETRETPAPDDRPKGGPGEGKEEEPAPPAPGEKPKPGPGDVSEKEKDLDEHLEELTGRKRKKDRDQGEGSGPLSDIIKEMREVEGRLGEPDTGEETRKKQAEIVKKFETVIEQLRQSSAQSSGKKKKYLTMKQGAQPGSKNGSQPGAMAGQAPNTRPSKPTDRRSTAGGKDIWGHLPPELRLELENGFNEEPLERQAELIRLYFLSLNKKPQSREE